MRFWKTHTAVGLDIGSHSVKVVELGSENGQVRLLRWGRAELIPDAIVDGEIIDRQHVVGTIKDLIENSGIRNRQVALSVSGRGVIVKRITVDRTGTDDADEAIRRAAEQHVPFDIGEVVMHYQILDEDAETKRMRVLLVVAKQDVVLSRLGIVRDAGLTPVVVDVDAFAVQNALLWSGGFNAGESIAMVNVGSERTNIHAVRGGVPLYTQDLATGTRNLVESIRRSRDVSHEVAFQTLVNGEADSSKMLANFVETYTKDLHLAVDRVGLFLKTSGSAEKVDRIVLTGGGSWVPGLIASLESKTNVPVEAGDPLARLELPGEDVGTIETRRCEFAVAVGLALRGAVEA